MQIGILEPKDFSRKVLDELKSYGKVELFWGENREKFLEDKDVLFIRLKYKIDKSFLEEAPSLKFICTPTTGLNHIDINEVEKRKIKIISLKGEYDFLSTIRATPEHTIGLLLALLRNYNKAFLNPKNNEWNRDLYKGYEVYGKTIGIIGMGRVGKILSKYFNAFDAKIVFYDIKDVDTSYNSIEVKDISSLIIKSDIIFLTASYSKENEKMIGKEEIDLMKDKFFINTSRGELVDEKYLLTKIAQQHFRGLALDVIENETDLGNNNLKEFLPLCEKNNFIITPHIAGATYESMWRTEEFISEKLIRNFL